MGLANIRQWGGQRHCLFNIVSILGGTLGAQMIFVASWIGAAKNWYHRQLKASHCWKVKSIADAIVAEGLDKLGYQYVNMDGMLSKSRKDVRRASTQTAGVPKRVMLLASFNQMRIVFLLECPLWSTMSTAKASSLVCIPVSEAQHAKTVCLGAAVTLHRFHFSCAPLLALMTLFEDESFWRMLKLWPLGKWTLWSQTFVTALGSCFVIYSALDRHLRDPYDLYHNFSAALNATGHPMLFSLCEWGTKDPTYGPVNMFSRDFVNKSQGVGMGCWSRANVSHPNGSCFFKETQNIFCVSIGPYSILAFPAEGCWGRYTSCSSIPFLRFVRMKWNARVRPRYEGYHWVHRDPQCQQVFFAASKRKDIMNGGVGLWRNMVGWTRISSKHCFTRLCPLSTPEPNFRFGFLKVFVKG